MEIALITVSAVLITIIFSFTFHFFSLPKKIPKKEEIASPEITENGGKKGKKSRCPICSSDLEGSERVSSVVFSSKMGKKAHIKGCPRCLEGDKPRFCPLCNAILRKDEVLTAWMLENNGKTALKIFGCSRCAEDSFSQ